MFGERSERLRGCTILVVHDDYDLARLFAQQLRLRGAETAIALSLERARRRLAELATLPHVALIDVGLPEGEQAGVGFAQWLLGQVPPVAVVLVSGSRRDALQLPDGIEFVQTGTVPNVQRAIELVTDAALQSAAAREAGPPSSRRTA